MHERIPADCILKKAVSLFVRKSYKIRFELRKTGSDILRPAKRNPPEGHIGPSFPFEYTRLLKYC